MFKSGMRPVLLAALVILPSLRLYGLPPTTGAQWWSTNPNLDCSTMHSLIYEIALPSGGKGYACGVTGTFPWLAAGGNWRTFIRAASPSSGPVGVQYVFYDGDGNPISLDTISGSVPASGSTVTLALNADQPSEIELLGASRDAPHYNTSQNGSVFALFLCPDPATCATVLPQMLYSFLPVRPWTLSVPISWDTSFSFLQPSGLSTRWSAVGISDATHIISFAIYNQSATSMTYTVRVYDSNGMLVGQATTPSIPGPAKDGAGAARGFLLADIINTLPQGILKVTLEGASVFSTLFLQFDGASATSLQTAHDSVPADSSPAVSTR